MLVWGTRRLQKPSMDTTLVRPSSISLARDLTESADKKCPFTGDVSIRGRILTGRVVSTKMTRTIVIRRDYLHFIPKYRACWTCYVRQFPVLMLCVSIRSIRETAQEPSCPRFPRVPCGFGRCRYGRYVLRYHTCLSCERRALTDLSSLGQCRPLSKTVRFNVLRVSKSKASTKTFTKF